MDPLGDASAKLGDALRRRFTPLFHAALRDHAGRCGPGARRAERNSRERCMQPSSRRLSQRIYRPRALLRGPAELVSATYFASTTPANCTSYRIHGVRHYGPFKAPFFSCATSRSAAWHPVVAAVGQVRQRLRRCECERLHASSHGVLWARFEQREAERPPQLGCPASAPPQMDPRDSISRASDFCAGDP